MLLDCTCLFHAFFLFLFYNSDNNSTFLGLLGKLNKLIYVNLAQWCGYYKSSSNTIWLLIPMMHYSELHVWGSYRIVWALKYPYVEVTFLPKRQQKPRLMESIPCQKLTKPYDLHTYNSGPTQKGFFFFFEG